MVVSFGVSGSQRIVRAVKRAEQLVQDGLRRGEYRSGELAGPNLQFVRCSSATASSGLYPAVLQDIGVDGALADVSPSVSVWLKLTSGTPTVNDEYLCMFGGYRSSDNLAIFICLFPLNATAVSFRGARWYNGQLLSVSAGTGGNIEFYAESFCTLDYCAGSTFPHYYFRAPATGRYLLGGSALCYGLDTHTGAYVGLGFFGGYVHRSTTIGTRGYTEETINVLGVYSMTSGDQTGLYFVNGTSDIAEASQATFWGYRVE